MLSFHSIQIKTQNALLISSHSVILIYIQAHKLMPYVHSLTPIEPSQELHEETQGICISIDWYKSLSPYFVVSID